MQARTDGGKAPKGQNQPLFEKRTGKQVEQQHQQQQHTAQQALAVVADELPPAHQQPRHERQIAADVSIDMAEARHYVEHQEYHHQPADACQHHRINRSADYFPPDTVHLRLIGDIACQRFG